MASLTASLTAPLKYCQLLRSFSEMVLNLLRDAAGICCSNRVIFQVRCIKPCSGFGRMISSEFDLEPGSQQLVVSVNELSALVHAANSLHMTARVRDKDVINCFPSGTITAVPGPMMDAFA